MTDTSTGGDTIGRHAEQWYAAIEKRHSTRSYDATPLSESARAELAATCEGLSAQPQARVVFVPDPKVDVFRGIVGSYGKVTGAPSVLLVIASEAPFAEQHAGYVGELAVLAATALGLQTCWIGGFFDREKVLRLETLSAGERVLAVSPVGHGKENSLTDRTMHRLARSRTRKCVAELAPGSETWPEWAKACVEAARLAPSAINRQPWRFRFEGGALLVTLAEGMEDRKRGVSVRLDCGIAMAHVELAARARGTAGSWSDLSGRDVARFEPRPAGSSE